MSKEFYDLSAVPKNWKYSKLKYILSISENTSDNPCDEKNLSLTKNGIIEKKISSNEGQIASSYEKYILTKKGQISMNPMDLLTGWVDISSLDGLISPAYYTFLLKKDFDTKFVNYFLQSNYYRETFFKLGKGVASHNNYGRWILTPDELKNICFFYPILKEQKFISSYIDKKTQQIDKMLEISKKKIELLKEHKKTFYQYLISGIDKNVEMKDTQLSWIGKIPKHWNIMKLSRVIKSSRLGKNFKTISQNTGVPVMKMGNIGRGYINLKNIEYLEDIAHLEEEDLLTKGDFIFNTRNSSDLVGKVSLWDGSLNNSTYNSNILKINFNEYTSSEYMSLLFNCFSILEVLRLTSKGTTSVSAIYYKDLSNIFFPIPPINEQNKIKNLINKYLSNNLKSINLEIKKINLLYEYRKSIISLYITGTMFADEDEK